MIKAIIFDMDGLLVDSEPLWQEAEIMIFIPLGVPLSKEMARTTMGLRIDEVVEHWFTRYPWQETTKKVVEDKVVEKVIELIEEKGRMLKGVEEIIKLFATANMPMAIASSSQTRVIDAVLKKISIREYIRVVHSAEEEPYGKPHPGVYITAAKKLGVSPEYCLAFEDSPNGVLSAKAAGMKCIAVPDSSVREDEGFTKADMVLDSLEDFHIEYLKRF